MGNLSAEWVLAITTFGSALLAGIFSLLVPIIRQTTRMERTIRIIHTISNQQATDGVRYLALLEQLLELNDSPIIPPTIPASDGPRHAL